MKAFMKGLSGPQNEKSRDRLWTSSRLSRLPLQLSPQIETLRT